MPAVAKTDRETILQAALKLLRRDGLAALSLRALATEVGIATNALYHYFPSRDDLTTALSEAAAEKLHATLKREVTRKVAAAKPAITARHTAEIRATALAEGYLRFAQREPHLYAAMIHKPCGEQKREAYETLWKFVCEIAAALHGQNRAAAAAVSLWALLHGTVSLHQAGAIYDLSPAESIHFGLQAWMNART